MDICRLGFLGAGVMASALIDGLLRAGVISCDRLMASDPLKDTRQITRIINYAIFMEYYLGIN